MNCTRILKYILTNNVWYRIPVALFRSILYQIFKRLTGSIISKFLFNNKQILLYPDCNVSTMFVYSDIPDEQEIKLLRANSDKHTIFFDIGSNVGSYSIMLMDKVKDIYAFEPHPHSANRCRMNFMLNGFDPNRVKELAIGDKQGEAYLTNHVSSSTINRIITNKDEGIRVLIDSLDNFVFSNKFDKNSSYIIKIDVEGFEKEVLIGGKYFFQNYLINGIVVESFEENKQSVLSILRDYGYTINQVSLNNIFAYKSNYIIK